MSHSSHWATPNGIQELLPLEASKLEALRQQLLIEVTRWGYDLVKPPMVEFLDSLLTGTAKDLSLRTPKLVDQASGRLLGLRADVTPQVARMDAHELSHRGINRLCYVEAVLFNEIHPVTRTRNPIQLGAELFGEPSLEADLEVMALLVRLADFVSIAKNNLSLVLGTVSIYHRLLDMLAVSTVAADELLAIVRRKSFPDLALWIEKNHLPADQAALLSDFVGWQGDGEWLKTLLATQPVFADDIQPLLTLAESLQAQAPELTIQFDLADLRGYQYHTGVIFSLYATDELTLLGRGGRYNGVGSEFGQDRPATGFSVDLGQWLPWFETTPSADVVIMPGWMGLTVAQTQALKVKTEVLRHSGVRVIQQLPGMPTKINGVNLVWQNDDWQVIGAE